jgi:hypothetical protein
MTDPSAPLGAGLALASPRIPATSPAALAEVRELEANLLALPQVAIETRHVLHGGMYARTIIIPANVVLTGALIRIATLLVIDGDVLVHTDGEPMRITGRHVLPASAGRKQAFVILAETHLTMLFPTRATTVEEAEDEFTDEAGTLFSRAGANHITITGE